MPVKLNVGLSKKIGLPDYGSLGASVNLELELDTGTLSDPDRLRQQIKHLFGLAETSIEDELRSQQSAPESGVRNGHGHIRHPDRSHNGHPANHGPTSPRSSNGRAATQSQVRAIKSIASRQRLDLTPQLMQFGVQAIEDLGIQQASELIDELKAQPADAGANR